MEASSETNYYVVKRSSLLSLMLQLLPALLHFCFQKMIVWDHMWNLQYVDYVNCSDILWQNVNITRTMRHHEAGNSCLGSASWLFTKHHHQWSFVQHELIHYFFIISENMMLSSNRIHFLLLLIELDGWWDIFGYGDIVKPWHAWWTIFSVGCIRFFFCVNLKIILKLI